MFYDEVRRIAKGGIPIYIWGSGEVGKLVHKRLDEIEIVVEDYVTDLKNGEGTKVDVLKESSIEYAIVRGWLGSFYMTDAEIMKRFEGCKYVLTISDIYEPDIVEQMDVRFYEDNKSRFDNTRAMLADGLSKKTFDAFIESKTKHTNDNLLPLVIPKQYFFENHPWVYSDEEVLVDCGAFDGDSIRAFLDLRGDRYKEIIALEPDKENFEELKSWVAEAGIKRILPINSGVYKEKTTLSFKNSGNMEACFSEDGEIRIPVESIDNVCCGKEVSLIKLDIEGSEKDALLGSVETIKKYQPLLMISIYHRRDDLFVLTEFINSISKDYIFFLRAHKPLPIDVVLYAVPRNRIKI